VFPYVKALHIIFVVTWFSGLFYVVRLFIYNTEALEKPEAEREILQRQFAIMIRRLWLGITWPSCIATFIFGFWLLSYFDTYPDWLWTKLGFVLGLFLYHLSLHYVYGEQDEGVFRFTSRQLRLWNELATLFLFAIVFLVILKDLVGLFWGMVGLAALTAVLLVATEIYRRLRHRS
jgi:putative membrane protein